MRHRLLVQVSRKRLGTADRMCTLPPTKLPVNSGRPLGGRGERRPGRLPRAGHHRRRFLFGHGRRAPPHARLQYRCRRRRRGGHCRRDVRQPPLLSPPPPPPLPLSVCATVVGVRHGTQDLITARAALRRRPSS